MKNLLCLAMSFGFISIFYLYIRNRLSVIDARLNTLTDIVHTLASEFSVKEKNILTGIEGVEHESDTESGSESGSESESESGSESDNLSVEFIKVTEPLYPKIIKQEIIELNDSFTKEKEKEKEPIIEFALDNQTDLIEVSDDESTIKHVQIELTDYSALTLKELKQKVVDLGGPSLKTKKLLIDFLEKKV